MIVRPPPRNATFRITPPIIMADKYQSKRRKEQMVDTRREKASFAWKLSIGLLIVTLLTSLCTWADSVKSRWYIFDPVALQKLVDESLELYPESTAGAVHHIVTSLREQYGPDLIGEDPFPHATPNSTEISPISPYVSQWVFNNAGGAMGSMYIIHASITEYLIIFGTPLGTEGHSGRHTADDYFYILEGEQWAYSANSLVKERYPKGTMHHHPKGAVKQYKMHRGCFALELAQGWIPPMLPFGFADTLFSTLDFPTFANTVWLTAQKMVGCLLVGKI
ncbi:hypothetical protein AYO21_10099 [Fonsecaea monophora]|uniref:C-8 sterol isomerase n=1 Tax=Fonsecaea monophora TaxID=254056 RepID=A0A177EUK2_9EURO|nr:hypothetical protein AYO21_10099 [Fonsecaea monophora]KAH0846120.1 C-8 sterol isomerase [Fonsecaea pedrosoi]OAG35705.1 hypothetical protein AYO21_10099 [Fonsecaea monophora]